MKHDSLAAKRTVSESERMAEGERRSNPSSGAQGQRQTAEQPMVVRNVHAPEERAARWSVFSTIIPESELAAAWCQVRSTSDSLAVCNLPGCSKSTS